MSKLVISSSLVNSFDILSIIQENLTLVVIISVIYILLSIIGGFFTLAFIDLSYNRLMGNEITFSKAFSNSRGKIFKINLNWLNIHNIYLWFIFITDNTWINIFYILVNVCLCCCY